MLVFSNDFCKRYLYDKVTWREIIISVATIWGLTKKRIAFFY